MSTIEQKIETKTDTEMDGASKYRNLLSIIEKYEEELKISNTSISTFCPSASFISEYNVDRETYFDFIRTLSNSRAMYSCCHVDEKRRRIETAKMIIKNELLYDEEIAQYESFFTVLLEEEKNILFANAFLSSNILQFDSMSISIYDGICCIHSELEEYINRFPYGNILYDFDGESFLSVLLLQDENMRHENQSFVSSLQINERMAQMFKSYISMNCAD